MSQREVSQFEVNHEVVHHKQFGHSYKEHDIKIQINQSSWPTPLLHAKQKIRVYDYDLFLANKCSSVALTELCLIVLSYIAGANFSAFQLGVFSNCHRMS